MSETNNTRLDRIEEKIDRLSDAMIAIARTEEKLIAMESRYALQYERMNRFADKLDTIERKVEDSGHSVSLHNKLVGAGAALILTILGAAAVQFLS
jgi:hypothetical protein